MSPSRSCKCLEHQRWPFNLNLAFGEVAWWVGQLWPEHFFKALWAAVWRSWRAGWPSNVSRCYRSALMDEFTTCRGSRCWSFRSWITPSNLWWSWRSTRKIQSDFLCSEQLGFCQKRKSGELLTCFLRAVFPGHKLSLITLILIMARLQLCTLIKWSM